MAVDFHLKLDGISGEDEDQNHKGEIQVSSFSWGGSQVTSVAGTGGSGAGKVNCHDFTVMTNLDKATPGLWKSLTTGAHVKTGTFFGVKAGASGKPFLQIDFQELFVTNLSVSGSSEIPAVGISFSYNDIKLAYSTQNEQGITTLAQTVGYNVKGNKPY